MWLFELTNQPLQNPNKLKVKVIISFGDQSEHLNERSRSIKTHYKQWVLHNLYRGDHRRQVWSMPSVRLDLQKYKQKQKSAYLCLHDAFSETWPKKT